MNDLMMDRPQLKTTAWTQTDNEKYCKSQEWKDQLKQAEKAVQKSYTIIYRDLSGELQETWVQMSDDNIEYVKAKYKKAKKDIYYFGPKTLPFGEKLKSLKGNSKNAS